MRILVVVAIPLRVVVRVPQAKISAEIDDNRRDLTEADHFSHGHAMRQRGEEDIDWSQILHRRELQISAFTEVWVNRPYELAGISLGGYLLNRHLGVSEEETHELA